MHKGSINETEFIKLKGRIDKRIRSLEIKNISYELPRIHPLKLVCPMFAKVSSKSFEILTEKQTEREFKKGDKLLSKGKSTQYVYIITSGYCVEEYDNINIRKGVGSIFSLTNIPNPFVSKTND